MFELVSDYQPAGDQPQAIARLTEDVLAGAEHQVLLGVKALPAVSEAGLRLQNLSQECFVGLGDDEVKVVVV